ncbi:MAG TPA: hypothetical protein VMN60_07815 [Longimicrobiales bacterium]|nr:hypothetical protein [Longimicrobiales bacterium]
MISSFRHVSDADLLVRVREAASHERRATATVIALLMELDTRRLYLGEGYSSLFTYCTQVLHLSEHAAYGRIEAARAARRFPALLVRLEEGTLTLTSLCLLAPHLTAANHEAVLDEACHKSKREVEQIVARLSPKSDVAATLRKVPARHSPAVLAASGVAPLLETGEKVLLATGVGDSALPPTADPVPTHPTHGDAAAAGDSAGQALRAAPRADVTPLSPERFKLQLTISRDTHARLRRVQDLLRHTVPDGNLEIVIDKALTLLLEHVERAKLAAARRPRASRERSIATRYIPASVKRTVWHETVAAVRFTVPRGDAPRRGSWSFTTWCRLPPAARRAPRISSYAVVRTTPTRRCNGWDRYRWCAKGAASRLGHSVRTELGGCRRRDSGNE